MDSPLSLLKTVRVVTPENTLLTLVYELGSVVENYMKSQRHPGLRTAYMAYLETELGDVLAQTQVLCELFGWDIDEIRKMGIESLATRVEEIRDRQGKFEDLNPEIFKV